MHKASILLIALFLLSLSATVAMAAGPYEFVSEYVRELIAIEKIRDQAAKELTEKGHNQLADCVETTTRFQLELNTSISMLKSMSLKPPLNELTPNIAEFYTKKVALYKQLGDGCSMMIAGPKPNVDYGEIAGQAPKINALLDFIDQSLFKITPLVFASLIDQKPDSENHLSHLVITKQEGQKLVRELDLGFGAKMDQDNQNWTVSSATVLKGYFNKGYKFSDDPW
jgi:hypothetical protein